MAPEQQQQTHTGKGFERFIFFSDAVVAIAISLLILPVVDAVADGSGDPGELIRDQSSRLFALALSFVVIAKFWQAHHTVFEGVNDYSGGLMGANFLWLFTIVFLPLPTELLSVHGADDGFVRFFYIVSVLATSLAIVLIELVIDRSPPLWRDRVKPARSLRSELVLPATIVVALVVAVTVPAVGMWAMLVMFLGGPIARRL